MNFFEHQDRARSKTTQLVFLFMIAVAGIIVALYLASRIVLRYGMANSAAPMQYAWWDPGAFAGIAVVGILFIGLASLARSQSLRGGGGKVATMLGGRLVNPNTTDFKERRLLNIVEEMAIASGIPVPQVYVLDQEEGINAFAAGHSTSDAVVAVTRGTLDNLNREELQGVIGHEFSHILNGDMRLNIRLIGVLFGIFAITIVGRILSRAMFFGRSSRKGGGPAAVALVGVLLILIGYIGVLVGRIIQSAVSRQREYLADASAVQFTRNPSGIVSALKKIGGYSRKSYIQNPRAEQANHLFFERGQRLNFLTGIFATHPPLEERIRRIDAGFDGEFEKAKAPAMEAGGPGELAMGFGPSRIRADAGSVSARVGRVTPEHYAAAAALRRRVPERLNRALSGPEGATAVVYALLLEPDRETREREIAALAEHLDDSAIETVRTLQMEIEAMDSGLRLPLVELAMPVLRELSGEATDLFLARMKRLVEADERITLFEFLVQWMVGFQLGRADRPPARIRHRSLSSVLKDLAIVLSALSRTGNPDNPRMAREAFGAGIARVVDPERVSVPYLSDVGFVAVGRAFDRLSQATYAVREKVIDACAHTALADRTVTIEEGELLRVVSMALDCPLPPFLGS